jgi:hypothetical protein
VSSALCKVALWPVGFVTIFSPVASSAATLKPETLSSWEEYVRAATARMQERLNSNAPFLGIDEEPDRAAQLRSGEILVSPVGPHVPERVPSGLIHHWMGAAFIPNATLRNVLPVVRDYGHYKEIYHPAVIDSKAVTKSDSEDRFSMLLMNRSIILRTALDSDYRSTFFRVNDHRMYSISEATRIREIAGYGTDRQHELAEDEGSGIIWRIHSITRFEERDGGVYVEVEVMALSRDVPLSLRWMVDPIVRRISRESLLISLRQTQDAVLSSAGLTDRNAASAGVAMGGMSTFH